MRKEIIIGNSTYIVFYNEKDIVKIVKKVNNSLIPLEPDDCYYKKASMEFWLNFPYN